MNERPRSSDALEQVGIAVGSSAAVAELPDARPELHGTAVAHPTLQRAGGRSRSESRTRARMNSGFVHYSDESVQ